MKTLNDFFNNVKTTLASPKFKDCEFPLFRGHSDSRYTLLPTLIRDYKKTGMSVWCLENNLYADFRSLVGPRVSFKSTWEALYTMRHEGIPTRLLDWTENIGTALFFALSSSKLNGPHIWVINPYALNKKTLKDDIIINPEEGLKEYSETYAKHYVKPYTGLKKLPFVIYPKRSNERIFAQRGLFTVHGIDEREMEKTCAPFIQKIEIPDSAIDELKALVKYFGINQYSVYPDLKGLKDHLQEIYKY